MGADNIARDFARKFYNSQAWIKCREAYKQSVFGICERCEDPGIEVHHKIYLTPDNINNPEITLGWDNLELLCERCHSKEHMSKYDSLGEGYSFNANGDLIYTPPIKKDG